MSQPKARRQGERETEDLCNLYAVVSLGCNVRKEKNKSLISMQKKQLFYYYYESREVNNNNINTHCDKDTSLLGEQDVLSCTHID